MDYIYEATVRKRGEERHYSDKSARKTWEYIEGVRKEGFEPVEITERIVDNNRTVKSRTLIECELLD